jgi:plastocyanin
MSTKMRGCGLYHWPRRARGLLFAGLVGAGLSGPLAGLAATTNVNIVDFAFTPAAVTVQANDKVKWTWVGTFSHSTSNNAGLWFSGVHSTGFTYTNTFTAAGSFPYRCSVHPTIMLGTVTVQGAANLPPTVAITNPAAGAILKAPASFTLAATASDTDGTVTNVQFLQGGAVLGNVTAKPYSVQVNALPAGGYVFSAVATDNGGLKATNSVAITVNALPTVAITSPTNSTVLAEPATVRLQATATDPDDPVAQVQFFRGTTLLGETNSLTSQFSLTASNLLAGQYALSAVATDSRGGSTTSAVVSLTVVTPAAVILSSPRRLSPTAFGFDYTANTGLTYLVLRASILTNFAAVATNLAASEKVTFVDPSAASAAYFYRVRLAPNP